MVKDSFLQRDKNLQFKFDWCRQVSRSEERSDELTTHAYSKLTRRFARCSSLHSSQIARGMAYLHSAKNPIMHRDLKCSNVLVSKGYQMKISDFGESRRRQKPTSLDTAEGQTMSQAGTLLFMAPEMVTEYDYDISIDVYR